MTEPKRPFDEYGRAALEHVRESWWERRKARSSTKKLEPLAPQGPAADSEDAPRPPGWLPGDQPLRRYSFTAEVAKDYAATRPSIEELKRRSRETGWMFDDNLSLEGLQAESLRRRDAGRLPQSTVDALSELLKHNSIKELLDFVEAHSEAERKLIREIILKKGIKL